jgi:hypothetical protein
MQPDGAIVLYLAGLGPTYLARITAAGTLDTTLGTAGLLPTPIQLPLLQPIDLAATHLLLDGSTAWICDVNRQKVSQAEGERTFIDLVRVQW